MSSPKIFSLAEANELVPTVAALTGEAVEKLDQMRRRFNVDPDEDLEVSLPAEAVKEVETILEEWSQEVTRLGVTPKGYFTVDFQSVLPDMLYCWSYGEEEIGYTHKVWENFSHRRPIAGGIEEEPGHLKWVN